mmetsp:Transcript_147698/g.411363  ORF Transcript_147698/g.411363 Transcript_147698/m.411363 type:complete len:209 (-) Transcript_147698:574-1200(-)
MPSACCCRLGYSRTVALQREQTGGCSLSSSGSAPCLAAFAKRSRSSTSSARRNLSLHASSPRQALRSASLTPHSLLISATSAAICCSRESMVLLHCTALHSSSFCSRLRSSVSARTSSLSSATLSCCPAQASPARPGRSRLRSWRRRSPTSQACLASSACMAALRSSERASADRCAARATRSSCWSFARSACAPPTSVPSSCFWPFCP